MTVPAAPDLRAALHGLAALRRDLHAHPELAHDEHRTAGVVARELRAAGIEVHTGVGGTGVVGVLQVGDGGGAIALRADLDALPVQETNRFAHMSQVPGVMHACGHDGHVAMLLGAARHLAATRRFRGIVVFVFQPAEERGTGARGLLADGLLERFPFDAIYGLHNWPGLPHGRFATRVGALMAGTASFRITVHGRGTHAALPHLGIDPIVVACQLGVQLQLLVTRGLDPLDAAVLSVTQVQAGQARNAIPGEAVLSGTVRAFDDAVFGTIEAGLRRLAEGTCDAHGARADVSFERHDPAVVNDGAAVARAVAAMRELVGDDGVDAEARPVMAAEDFAWLARARPACYALLGAGDGAHREIGHGMGPCVLHHSAYDFDDRLLPVGVGYWVRLVERELAVHACRNDPLGPALP